DFWYLTGFDEPGACLVLLPAREGRPARTVLFLRPKDKEREIWDGRRLGVENAPAALGVDEAHDVARLWDELPNLLAGHDAIAWRFGDDDEADRRMVEVFTGLRASARGAVRPPASLLDPAPLLHELRVVKSEGELELMRSAAELTAAAHRDLMAFVAPGRNECEVEAFLDHAYRSNGSTGAAYGHICAGGANACILHYVENDQSLADGDLILVDSGAEWSYYAADITRTFPVNGRFSDDQRAIYEVVLNAELAAIDAVKPGARFDEVHQAALDVIVDGLIELGLVSGTRQEVLDAGSHRAFFMHKTSHWLGLDVHDQGRYFEDGESRVLEPGMVLTVEPGLYVDPENSDVDARWRGIGVRIEDDVVVTAEGREVLTHGAPKTVEDVEAACRAAAATGT
ncbi:MAG: aminopeptidase P N-terminal domain-containing protein, partial [Planctomycetota bacterium]|nr:aminopeptidase P N-terminal domain-containing protein [Planctomycetota bacterium]